MGTDTIYWMFNGYSFLFLVTVAGMYFNMCVCFSLFGTSIFMISCDGRAGCPPAARQQ